MRPIRGIAHLCFETRPWRTVAEFTACREDFDTWTRDRKKSLKTIPDLEDFLEFRAIRGLMTPVKCPHRKAALTLAKRHFLRAFVRSKWGLDGAAMSYSELSEWLTENGYRTSKEDVENAARPKSKLIEHSVPCTPATQEFCNLISKRFPEFESLGMLAKCRANGADC
jgi:hypothetical protein